MVALSSASNIFYLVVFLIYLMPDRPNILFVCTDQQSAGAMGCAGNADLKTPAMDKLAESGVLFENAYCTDPVCTPSRSSLFTGRMPHETGVTENHLGIPQRYRSQELGTVFDNSGYDCAYAGKWHLPEPSITDGHGFEKICGFDDNNIVDACIEFLQADREQPFLLSAQFDNPHNICEWARHQPLPWGNLSELPIEECPNLPTNYAIPPFEPTEIRPAMANDRYAMGAMIDASPEEWRRYRSGYYRLIERVDRQLGRILDVLHEESLAEETVVVFTSDHGDGQGAHQLCQKWWLYEEIVNIPFIVSYPPETADVARDTDHLVSNGLDIFPTVCDYAGVDPPEGLDGRSVRRVAAGDPERKWREYVVTEVFSSSTDHEPLDGRALRTEQYKYIVYDRGRYREQLFDLEADPGELVDLSTDADHSDVLMRHRELLLEWCLDSGDRFAVPNGLSGVPGIPGFDPRDLREQFD